MKTSFVHFRLVCGFVFPTLALTLISLKAVPFLASSSADEKRIAVYSTTANYSLPVLERGGRDYVGLLEILEPLGAVSAKTQGRRWKMRYKHVEGEFAGGTSHFRIRGNDIALPSHFLLENGRGLVPLSSLSIVLPRFLGSPVTFHESARRLFIGSVATQFAVTLSKTIPPLLVLNFTAPVNPTIATEPGRLRMVFTREPLSTVGTQTLTFDDRTIASATYQENNGTAEIAVVGNQPLMARFSNDGRTITIAPAPQASMASIAPAVTPTPPTATPPAPQAPPPAPVTTVAAPAPRPLAPGPAVAGVPHFLAAVDASHGGDERGAALTNELPEKDVTLAIARQVKQQLENHGISVLMLRDSDTNLGLDQRAALANMAAPSVYICIHASSQGNGVRAYTPAMPAGGENRGAFVAWNTAQSSFLTLSQTVVSAVITELQKKVGVRSLSASMRPLNNVTAPVFALEIAPPGSDVLEVASPAYQQSVATAVANGVTAFRNRSGAHP
jgi:N-acetylmuramoyl-L-alanine amidase